MRFYGRWQVFAEHLSVFLRDLRASVVERRGEVRSTVLALPLQVVVVDQALAEAAGALKAAKKMSLTDRAHESLRAAELCLREGLVHSATSRGYYAMFQAAQVALQEVYPAAFADYLSSALHARQLADYHPHGVSYRVAQRAVRRAAAFLSAVEKEVGRANQSAR